MDVFAWIAVHVPGAVIYVIREYARHAYEYTALLVVLVWLQRWFMRRRRR